MPPHGEMSVFAVSQYRTGRLSRLTPIPHLGDISLREPCHPHTAQRDTTTLADGVALAPCGSSRHGRGTAADGSTAGLVTRSMKGISPAGQQICLLVEYSNKPGRLESVDADELLADGVAGGTDLCRQRPHDCGIEENGGLDALALTVAVEPVIEQNL